MFRKVAFAALFLFLSTGQLSADDLPRTKVTGVFGHIFTENGEEYGCKIIIYKTIGYWVLYHTVDDNKIAVVPASIKGSHIEFTVPNDSDPSFEPVTFKGRITQKYLIGQFSNETEIVKIERCPL